MDKIQIITNHVLRPILNLWDLDKRDLKSLGVPEDETESLTFREFARYKGETYDISDFMATRIAPWNNGLPAEFAGWDGYASDSFFSGVLVKYNHDDDTVIMGRYYS